MLLSRLPEVAIVVVAIALFAYVKLAAAKDVEIQGSYSSSQIQAACDKAGGNFYQNSPEDGGGYGCYNENGNGGQGTAIDCDNGGHCIGTERPGRKVKGAGGATILGQMLR
jgi:hypothetical protein